MKRPTRRPTQIDPDFLHNVALAYLNRFDATCAKLREVLQRRVKRELGTLEQPPDEQQLARWIDELVTRYQGSGLLDDRRFAEGAVRSLRQRGCARGDIVRRLKLKGVGDLDIEAAFEQLEGDPRGAELESALRFVKRRRLGPFRQPEQRDVQRQKDLAKLARAGFSFDVARRALTPSGDEF